MNTLTDNECLEWLKARGLAAKPYEFRSSSPRHYKQFQIPRNATASSSMLASIVECAESFAAALLHVTDWSLYTPDEMAIVSAIRKAEGDHRRLIETPGHTFGAAERDLLIGLLSLVTAYDWTAYLYFDNGITLLSWEGEILDLWATDRTAYATICDCMQSMGCLPVSPERIKPPKKREGGGAGAEEICRQKDQQ